MIAMNEIREVEVMVGAKANAKRPWQGSSHDLPNKRPESLTRSRYLELRSRRPGILEPGPKSPRSIGCESSQGSGRLELGAPMSPSPAIPGCAFAIDEDRTRVGWAREGGRLGSARP
jgi:hypothetical protein